MCARCRYFASFVSAPVQCCAPSPSPASMTPAHLALTVAALLVCARADTNTDSSTLKISSDVRVDKSYNTQKDKEPKSSLPNDLIDIIYNTQQASAIHFPNERQHKSYSKKTELPSACLYDGRWHSDGATVSTREDCLRCVCARGALSCRRRACAALPDPLPPRCHVRHRRGFCCPELHCPGGVMLMEHGALARLESLDGLDVPLEAEVPTATPATAKNACVEGGSVFAAGSALGSRMACEQCFCLHGARRCVRPTCLPPPPHCAPRPAPGACCPERYYCNTPDKPTHHRNRYDCEVDGVLVAEGSAVTSRGNCSACFCLHGAVRCQALGCAPALVGCRPLLAPGECCAHQYICDHDDPEHPSHFISGAGNFPPSMRYDERTFHSSKSSKLESTTKKIPSLYTLKHTSIASATKNHLITTTKVKRKTDEPPVNASMKPEPNTNITSQNITTTQKTPSAAKLMAEISQSNSESSEKTTEQPEGTVKIMINGTINCTAELSSTSLPLSITNDTDKIQIEVMPRVPIVNVEAQTYSPNDIITDRNVNNGFDENDTFTINVTSSLMANTSHSTSRPVVAGPKISADLGEALNSSKKKGEYDYDYTEPTLPPSLPNLKIIPFVAADAVVDDEPSKDTYPILEREDKFPVYYPTSDTKDATYPNRREDTYKPTQYPVFTLGKVEPSYPPISHEVDLPRDRYPERNDLGVHEYTVSTSLGSHGSNVKTVTEVPTTSTTFALKTPAVNLFSPPVETEGGFIPKGSGVMDEYFGVYPSTPPGPAVPHLTTSMQLDIIKDYQGECISSTGQHVPSGQSLVLGCQVCTCSWVGLSCERRACAPPAPRCRRLPPSNHSRDSCCGDLDCHTENNTTSTNASNQNENKQNETEQVEEENTTFEPTTIAHLSNKTNTTNKNADNIETVTENTRTTPLQVKSESVATATTTVAPTTTKPTPKLTTTTTAAPIKQADDTSHESEEDDDEEFSFGSVLKLLLSDSYETTTAPTKKPATRPPPPPPRSSSTTAPSTEAETFFKPLPPRPYIRPSIPNTVNRIDHLVLGEATAIKRTTLRPITNLTTKPTPQTYETTERQEEPAPFTPAVTGGPWPPSLGGLTGGLLKLAGCNIYGRMYRVGRIITELSTPCQECWCTDIGVQCKPLNC